MKLKIKKIIIKFRIVEIGGLAFLISLACNSFFNLSDSVLLKHDILLNFLGILFTASLAILTIFYAIIQSQSIKDVIAEKHCKEYILLVIKEFTEDAFSFFVYIVLLVLLDIICSSSHLYYFYGRKIELPQVICLWILIMALYTLYDLLKAISKLMKI